MSVWLHPSVERNLDQKSVEFDPNPKALHLSSRQCAEQSTQHHRCVYFLLSRSRWRCSARMSTFNMICTQTPVYSVNHCCHSDPLTCRSAPSHDEETKQLFKQNNHMKREHLSASSLNLVVFLGFWRVILLCLSISASQSLLFYSFGP